MLGALAEDKLQVLQWKAKFITTVLIHLRRVTTSSCFTVKCFHKNIFLITLRENSLVPNITMWNKFWLSGYKQKVNRKVSVAKLIPTIQTQRSFNV